MKLFELPRRSLFTLSENPRVPVNANEGVPNVIYRHSHIDGMYSYATDAFNNVYHFAAWTEVEPYDSNLSV
jgi:hypothetical protein